MKIGAPYIHERAGGLRQQLRDGWSCHGVQKLAANLNIAIAAAQELAKFDTANVDVVEQLSVQFLSNLQVLTAFFAPPSRCEVGSGEHIWSELPRCVNRASG